MMLSPLRFVARAAAVASATLFPSMAALAADYTDLWWVPAESGWGVNVVQSDTFMFLTFFIYGSDRKPTWYTADLTQNSDGTFSGGLYLTGGSYYADPWNASDSPPAQQVGAAKFAPSSANNYEATLTYTVDGVATVVKQIQRQTLTRIRLGGSYAGGMGATQSGCSNSSNNGSYHATYNLQVNVTSANVATFSFDFSNYTCSIQGTLVQHGSQYTIDAASYNCTGGFSTNAAVSEIKATAQGIEGRWIAPTGGNCVESAQFSAVLL